MSQTQRIDGIIMHQSAGSLFTQQAERQRPSEPIISELVPTRLPSVVLLWPADHLDTPDIRGTLLAKAYSAFYPMEHYPVTAEGMSAGLASMLANLVGPNHVERGGELIGAFRKAGCRLERRVYNTVQEVEALDRDPRVRNFFSLFSPEGLIAYLEKREQQILCIGILLLTMGKDVNPSNYDGWIANRLRTFQGALGILPDTCCWSPDQCPPQESLTMCYRFLSASFHLRRILFKICVSGARDSSRFGAVLREVLVFLQGVEMGHILLIDRYIFGKYPELLRIRALRDNMGAINKALEYLNSIEPDLRFFVKLLHDKNETAVLNRQNFPLLAAAAVAAAQFETPSMKNYRGGSDTVTSGAITEVVRRYLSLRMNLSHIAISKSDYGYMSREETERFLAASDAALQGENLFMLPEVAREREAIQGTPPRHPPRT